MYILDYGTARRLFAGMILSVTAAGRVHAQPRSLPSELAIAQDAIGRTQARLPNLRLDEKSSRAAIGQLQVAMGATSREIGGRLFPSTTLEPADSVVRCASRAERSASWCTGLSPRNVLLLYRATRNADASVVVWIQAIQWEKPQATHPSSAVWKFQYHRSQDGTWTFDRELSGIAS